MPGSDLREHGEGGEGVDLRVWSMKLLSRYAYIVGQCLEHPHRHRCFDLITIVHDTTGDSPVVFEPIRSVFEARNVANRIDNEHDLAMACLNDDAPDRSADEIAGVLRDWMERRWGDARRLKAWWEK
jgi:hypothetical protein